MKATESREELIRRIKNLGILAMEDCQNIEDANAACDAIERFERQWPSELLAILIRHCEANREWVWKCKKQFQKLFWDQAKRCAKALFDMDMSLASIEEFIGRAFVGEDYHRETERIK